jgi:hypothetical protein
MEGLTMSVKSRYTTTSYIKHGAMRHARRKFQMCEDCKNRLESENPDNDYTEIPEIVNCLEEILTPKQLARKHRLQQKNAQNQLLPVQQQQKQQPLDRNSISQQFGEPVARNQPAMMAIGETTLMEDLSEMGKKMYHSMSSFGEGELNDLHKTTVPKPKEHDNDSFGV